jgi:Zn-dependent M16 (insulinase) family peptidase
VNPHILCSTGVPHILEHSVLCGSRKFPVKEPFVDLLRGSLQNFLNAFTYPDRTCYPVASTNTKDFYNLVNVYLDAVLHPRAVSDPQVLQQEGWHYELDGDDPSGALSIKGVVYNEMKGVYSSPDSLMARATQQALFPNNAYHVDSGGAPERIPDLTFEQFRAFHAQYYHPSNSRVFFYGDDDPQQRLVLLDSYLADFKAAPEARKASRVAYQSKVTSPSHLDVPFPISENAENKHMLTVNWVLNHAPLSPRDNLALAILDHLLLGTSSAPLKKALIESGLGESVTGGGLSDELLQSTFGVGLKGVQPENTAKVGALVQDTLKRLAQQGFDPADVQAAVNTVEFRLRKSFTCCSW